jgi:phage gp36-like protein
MAYSTQTTIENSCSVEKIRLYGDKNKDGVVDTSALNKAINDAEGIIYGYLYERYTTLLDSADSTTSKLLTFISDSISVYLLAATNNAISIPIDLRYKTAMDLLEKIKNYEINLPGFADTNRWETITEDLEFAEERVNESPYYPTFDDFDDKRPVIIHHF